MEREGGNAGEEDGVMQVDKETGEQVRRIMKQREKEEEE